MTSPSEPGGGSEPGPPPTEAVPGAPHSTGPDPGDAEVARPERPEVIPVGERPAAYDAGAPADNTLPKRRRFRGSLWRELPVLVLIAVVLALLIKTFLVQAFYIPSGSMEQTLHVNDRVLVNKVLYHLRDPHRGEIVVFDTKGTGFEGQGSDYAPCSNSNFVVDGFRAVQRFLGVGSCGQTDFIKRVIAEPGDTVQCCNYQGRVMVNGHALDEKYVYDDNHEPFCAAPPGSLRPAALGSACGPDAKPITVPKGMYWVMGDHRDDSSDSRPNGFVPRGKVVGRAFFKVWPPSRIGTLPVPKTFASVEAWGLQSAGTPALSAPLLLLPLVGLRWQFRRRGYRRRRGAGRRKAAS
ncbi:MAG TPA: signal peptidase I [Mycobacteriales bacterium]|nr:signal peptidase I [Mycobacteriales bacterium]